LFSMIIQSFFASLLLGALLGESETPSRIVCKGKLFKKGFLIG